MSHNPTYLPRLIYMLPPGTHRRQMSVPRGSLALVEQAAVFSRLLPGICGGLNRSRLSICYGLNYVMLFVLSSTFASAYTAKIVRKWWERTILAPLKIPETPAPKDGVKSWRFRSLTLLIYDSSFYGIFLLHCHYYKNVEAVVILVKYSASFHGANRSRRPRDISGCNFYVKVHPVRTWATVSTEITNWAVVRRDRTPNRPYLHIAPTRMV